MVTYEYCSLLISNSSLTTGATTDRTCRSRKLKAVAANSRPHNHHRKWRIFIVATLLRMVPRNGSRG